MKGATEKRVTNSPAIAPDKAPKARASRTPSAIPAAGGRPVLSVEVTTIPATATTDPTDRSIPEVRITNVIPAAMIAVMEAWSETFRRFSAVKKCGDRRANATHSTARAAANPSSAIRRHPVPPAPPLTPHPSRRRSRAS